MRNAWQTPPDVNNLVFFTRKLLVALALAFAETILSAQTPSPALLILNKNDNTLSIFDPAAKKAVATVSTGEGPHEVAASEDGKLAFVTNYGPRASGNTLSVIDISARKELGRLDLGTLRE